MSQQSDTGGHGIGFVGALTIAFVVLKLLHKITWSWVWVLSPLWISFAIALPILIVVGILAWRER
jgi:hypothetical protein